MKIGTYTDYSLKQHTNFRKAKEIIILMRYRVNSLATKRECMTHKGIYRANVRKWRKRLSTPNTYYQIDRVLQNMLVGSWCFSPMSMRVAIDGNSVDKEKEANQNLNKSKYLCLSLWEIDVSLCMYENQIKFAFKVLPVGKYILKHGVER